MQFSTGKMSWLCFVFFCFPFLVKMWKSDFLWAWEYRKGFGVDIDLYVP